MRNFFATRFLALLAWLLLLGPIAAIAAPFTPGNLVVVRIGDGSATALTAAAAPTFLLEYTPTGTLVQTIALPTAASGANSILTNTGSSSSDALLTRSLDGSYLVLTGYDAAVGTASLAGTTAAANNRIIGRVAANGNIDTSTRLNDGFSTGNIRSAVTIDGTSFFAVGSTSGVRYVPFGNSGTAATTVVSATPANNRGVGIYGGNLYVSSQTSSAPGFYGISQVGTGLPTTSGQTTTLLPGFPNTAGTSTPSPYGFYFADLSTSVPGVDVVYIADDRTASPGGIQKWSLVGGTWTYNGSMAASPGVALRGLDGNTSGTTVSLVASGNTTIFLVTDNAGYNAAPSNATITATISATLTNAVFRGVAFAPVALTPTITSFTPTTGATGTTVTITGTNLTGATAVTLNGAAITGFTVVNATTITFAVPAGATSGTIAVTTPNGTATSTGTFTYIPDNALPTITSLAPATAVAGSAGFTLTVNGTGFVSSSVINFNGTALTTTFVSATQLTAAVPAAAVATAGTYNVTVTSPAPGGGTSTAATFTVTTPVPTITSFTPTTGQAGDVVTITGTDFTGATAVTLNSVAITGFTVVNATTITFTVPAGASSGSIAVTTPGGTATSTGTFTVIVPNTAPTITSLAPATAVAGSAGFTLTVNGTGFISASVINFNGTALTTTFVSATQVTAAVPATAVATAGTYNVTATNPAPGGGTSAGVTFTVTTPAPTIASFTPTSGLAGTTVTITGTDFTGATAVTLNGVAITGFTVVNATTITFAVPAGATSGTIAVTTPSGTATSTAPFTVTLPAPTITTLAPATTIAGSAAFTLTVNGTNFISTSVVNFGSTALATTFVSATQLTATVPAAAVATAGTYNVTVANPSANQGGTSAAATFTVTVAAPTITSFTPTSGLVGDLVTITGTNFTGATAVTLNGAAITGFTVVNATTITFTVPASATSGTIAVTTPGGTATSTATFTVTPPVVIPVISQLAPGVGVVGGGAVTLTITGTGFTPTSTVNFNGVSYPQTTSTATSISALIPASVFTTAGSFPVTVTNSAGTSNAFTFTVNNATTAGAFEDFETGTKTGYAAGSVALASGSWTFSDALVGTAFNDRSNGLKSARIRVGFIRMDFDKPTGAGTVIVNAATFGNDTGATFLLEKSTDGGTTFTAVAGAPTTLTSTLTPYTFTVNQAGNVRFRITSTATTTTQRINIDDISISNYTAPALPTITSFTPTTGGPGATVTVTGTNFTGATAVRIGSFNVPSFTVVSATSITFVVPGGTGSVNGLISVVTPGGTATSTAPFNLVSAVAASNALPGLTVFPNPATDRITVALPSSAPATVALRDLAGRLVLAPATLGADKQVLLPASLASGVYLLEVRQGATFAVRRIEKN